MLAIIFLFITFSTFIREVLGDSIEGICKLNCESLQLHQLFSRLNFDYEYKKNNACSPNAPDYIEGFTDSGLSTSALRATGNCKLKQFCINPQRLIHYFLSLLHLCLPFDITYVAMQGYIDFRNLLIPRSRIASQQLLQGDCQYEG